MSRHLETVNQPILVLSHAVETSRFLTKAKGRHTSHYEVKGNVKVAKNARKIVSIGNMATKVNSYESDIISDVFRRRIQASLNARPRCQLEFIERLRLHFWGQFHSISGGIFSNE